MATENAAAIVLPAKRKRNHVSYAIDDYFNSEDFVENDEDLSELQGEESEDDHDDDGAFRPGKKPIKRKQPKRKAKKAKTSGISRPNKDEKPFPFLSLPPELRDEIYDLALTDPNGHYLFSTIRKMRRITVRGHVPSDKYRSDYSRERAHRPPPDSQSSIASMDRRSLIPNLLATCKQIRDEASAILYKQELVMADTTALLNFVTAIGPYNRTLLSRITIKGYGHGRGVQKGHNFAALSALSTCTNLRSVFFDCNIGHRYYRYGIERLATQLFRDGHYFFEAIGAAHGKKDAAADILEINDDRLWKKRDFSYNANWWEKEGEMDYENLKMFKNELRALLNGEKRFLKAT